MSLEDEGLMGYLMSRIPVVTQLLGLEDYRVVINHGASAGQAVFSVHIHLMGGRAKLATRLGIL